MFTENDSYEFAQVLAQSRERGEVEECSGRDERRKFPRLKINTSDLWVDSTLQFKVVNMSPSGVALNCNHPIRLGELLKLGLGPIQGAAAIVLGCELMESPTEYLDAQYRVHCKFLNIKEGMNLVIKTKQLDQLPSQKPERPRKRRGI